MAATHTLAIVQMDVRLADVEGNLQAVATKLEQAADLGATHVVFPECALTGYGLKDRETAKTVAQTIPGPATETLAAICKSRNVFAIVGMIESDGHQLYNSAAILGPQGCLGSYRKIHLPCVGIDRMLDPGNRPFAVHDLGGMKVGVGICFDASFPESIRTLTLMGADLICLPTNWSEQAIRNATLVSRVRALENHVYYASVNRVGDETGFHYIGHSSICNFNGDYLAFAEHDQEAILVAPLDALAARQKKVVFCAGEYEIDRVNWRRPEMYGKLVEPVSPWQN